MSTVTITRLNEHYAGHHALKDINLSIEKGEFIVMVGPSGCGKSTLLKTIAGLESLTDGSIHIGGRDVSRAEPGERGIAMVFQSYALYPHMTVAENMGFGLRMAGRPKAEIDAAVARAAAILRLEGHLEKLPKSLSGGQRQRVAIGRAITRSPEVFLFDEPLSNLDAALRTQMRVEIARLHHELGATMVYVTHDQVEAMTMADRIVVLRAGVIEQVGAPLALYTNPANRFVAGFIGAPRMNFIAARYSGGRVTIEGLPPLNVKFNLDLPEFDSRDPVERGYIHEVATHTHAPHEHPHDHARHSHDEDAHSEYDDVHRDDPAHGDTAAPARPTMEMPNISLDLDDADHTSPYQVRIDLADELWNLGQLHTSRALMEEVANEASGADKEKALKWLADRG